MNKERDYFMIVVWVIAGCLILFLLGIAGRLVFDPDYRQRVHQEELRQDSIRNVEAQIQLQKAKVSDVDDDGYIVAKEENTSINEILYLGMMATGCIMCCVCCMNCCSGSSNKSHKNSDRYDSVDDCIRENWSEDYGGGGYW